jgi:hypothetical protein
MEKMFSIKIYDNSCYIQFLCEVLRWLGNTVMALFLLFFKIFFGKEVGDKFLIGLQ